MNNFGDHSVSSSDQVSESVIWNKRRQLVLFAILPVLMIALSLVRYRSHKLSPPDWNADYVSPRTYSKAELKTQFNGKEGKPSYLVIFGEVYDVTGSEHYEGEGGYSIFIGQDATTAFVTGKFDDENPSDDLSTLDALQLKGVEDWIKFYRTHATYKFVGVVKGRYYNQHGKRTRQWREIKAKFDSAAEQITKNEQEAKKYPACNTKWTQDQGTVLWCEDSMSNGAYLGSPLVPRKLETAEMIRCVCVEYDLVKANEAQFKVYANCEGKQQVCEFKQ